MNKWIKYLYRISITLIFICVLGNIITLVNPENRSKSLDTINMITPVFVFVYFFFILWRLRKIRRLKKELLKENSKKSKRPDPAVNN